jgi:hypothetical protein
MFVSIIAVAVGFSWRGLAAVVVLVCGHAATDCNSNNRDKHTQSKSYWLKD